MKCAVAESNIAFNHLQVYTIISFVEIEIVKEHSIQNAFHKIYGKISISLTIKSDCDPQKTTHLEDNMRLKRNKAIITLMSDENMILFKHEDNLQLLVYIQCFPEAFITFTLENKQIHNPFS
ncbi:hypothetical protein MAR_009764 [Mya arenaria]|uniref:Uncharacterized protein n=1 Tax=Mya arenaria TaxID=6604 RepID=A0ABY7E7U0_MYAAR|nr:hypothetical protein MAR_009764 [Mya arenaria]